MALFVLTESQQGASTTTDTSSSPLLQERLRVALQACRPDPAAVAALPTSVFHHLHLLCLPFLRTTVLLRNAMLGTSRIPISIMACLPPCARDPL